MRSDAVAARAATPLALVALGELERKRTSADALLRRLCDLQESDGCLRGTSAHGAAAPQIEATALAVLAWQRSADASFAPNIHKAIHWLRTCRDERGGFGPGRPTVLVLKALLNQFGPPPPAQETGQVLFHAVGAGSMAAQSVPAVSDQVVVLKPSSSPDVWLPAVSETFVTSVVGNTTSTPVPYRLAWSYAMTRPPSGPDGGLLLKTRLSKELAEQGDRLKMSLELQNRAGADRRGVVAVLGLPAGIEPAETSAMPERVDLREVHGRELRLSWHELKAGAKVVLEIDVVCRFAGRYRGSPSFACAEGDGAAKAWAPPLAIAIDSAK